MTKQDFIDAKVDKTKLSKMKSYQIVDLIFEIMKEEFEKGPLLRYLALVHSQSGERR